MNVETCDECGFDNRTYTHDDVLGTMRTVAPWYGLLTEHVDDATLRARPDAATRSAIQYGEHMADVLNLLAFGLQWMIDDDEPTFPSIEAQPASEVVSSTPLADVQAKLGDAAATMQKKAKQVRGDAKARTARLGDGTTIDAGWLARHAVHDVLHHLHDVGRNLVALGVGPAHATGTVEQISASGGGVPKLAVDAAVVGTRGLESDRQRERRHHGRVWQALCVFSAEAIEAFQREGHSIANGSAGENFTVRGIDWAALRPGVQIQIGEVRCELSVPALPCHHNARWFSDGDFMRMHHERDRARTRWYATVVDGGTVRAGDEVTVLP